MPFETITVEREVPIAIVTLIREKMLNALNRRTFLELAEAFHELEADNAVRVVILTGKGKAFVAGADISEMKDMDGIQSREFSQLGQSVMAAIEHMEKPVIAAINGYALGGGCELAMCCDLRIASEHAKLGQPEVNLGLIPGFAGTQRLPRLVGLARAKELLYTGDHIDAQTAFQYGLINRIVPEGQLMDASKKLARSIASKGPVAIRLVKSSVNQSLSADPSAGGAYESEAFGLCFASGQAGEGMRAFLEKRNANW
jgi:enoyl-CoA hydratase